MKLNNNQQAFLALVRAGLWEKNVQLSQYEPIDYKEIYRLAQEQSVVGLVAAGLEHVKDLNIPKEDALVFVGEALQLEQRNSSMNFFIEVLIEKLREADIYAILVKGQGVAQCYERPLWRTCGDVDLFLSPENYEKAKSYLIPLASNVDDEDKVRKHQALTIETWVVELHGEMPCEISRRADKGVGEVKKSIFEGGEVRSWMNGNTLVFLPSPENDVIIVFTHILRHFFYGGIGLRQICDWCRLLWTYREKLDMRLLERCIRRMGLMTEWRAFASLAVNSLKEPEGTMPMYESAPKWSRKTERILACILETGNFGHNRDMSYFEKHSFIVSKAISFWRNTEDSIKHMTIFPVDAIRVWWWRFVEGINVALKKVNL